jgi:hypothetical protein
VKYLSLLMMCSYRRRVLLHDIGEENAEEEVSLKQLQSISNGKFHDPYLLLFDLATNCCSCC